MRKIFSPIELLFGFLVEVNGFCRSISLVLSPSEELKIQGNIIQHGESFVVFFEGLKVLFKAEKHGRMENYIEIDEYVMRKRRKLN